MGSTTASTISVRITEEQVQGIDFIAQHSRRKKSEMLREIVDLGLREKRLELALQKFQQKEATAWKAARLAGVPLTSFLDVLTERRIIFHYSPEDVEKEFRGFR